MSNEKKSVPSISVSYAHNGASTKANVLGMRPMQERVYEKRGEQYLLIKSPPASGKIRALGPTCWPAVHGSRWDFLLIDLFRSAKADSLTSITEEDSDADHAEA